MILQNNINISNLPCMKNWPKLVENDKLAHQLYWTTGQLEDFRSVLDLTDICVYVSIQHSNNNLHCLEDIMVPVEMVSKSDDKIDFNVLLDEVYFTKTESYL